MKLSKAVQSVLAILAGGVALAAAVCLLPENAYQRWQLLDGTIQANARWIYERCNFDSRPIDVAFIGPSRLEEGVNAPRLAQALAARGLPANVVNFSLPENGRNVNYAIVEQLLRTKHPKLIVLGVIEKPGRYGHPAFKYIASTKDIVDPAYLGNANFPSDLSYLPFRHMYLFAADLWPSAMGLTKQFDPAHYRGPSVDTTANLVRADGTVLDRSIAQPKPELTEAADKYTASMHPPLLPSSMADIEFGDERVYIRRIAAMAQARNVKIAFLSLPYYTGPVTLQEQQFYESFGPVWNAGFVSSHFEWYSDYGHLTRAGSIQVTDWLLNPVAALLAGNSK